METMEQQRSDQAGERELRTCDVCGNAYDRTFTIDCGPRGGGTFDSFECAVHALAPRCRHCECRILGHGVESDGEIYCCAHCARQTGATEVQDRA